MKTLFYCIGIDVDKTSFKTSLMVRMDQSYQIKASRTFGNTTSGYRDLIIWVEKHIKDSKTGVSFVMEATGVYHEHLAFYLHGKGQKVHVVLATKARRYIQSLGIRSKNDKIDAQGLASMGLQQPLEEWKPCSKSIYQLRSLTRQLEVLQEARTSFLNQLEAATHSAHTSKTVIQSTQSIIKNFDKQISKCKKGIEELIIKDPIFSAKYKLVEPIKGMGLITFATIIAETGGFDMFKGQSQLVSYAGYDIVENQSGNRIGKTRISKKGNSHIRRIMHMASLNMVRYEVPVFKNLYERVYERTKIKMKGYVAIQRKLLCLIYTLWKRNEVFNPNMALVNTSGEHEPKLPLSVGSERTAKKTATIKTVAALDGHPYDHSPEVLFR